VEDHLTEEPSSIQRRDGRSIGEWRMLYRKTSPPASHVAGLLVQQKIAAIAR